MLTALVVACLLGIVVIGLLVGTLADRLALLQRRLDQFDGGVARSFDQVDASLEEFRRISLTPTCQTQDCVRKATNRIEIGESAIYRCSEHSDVAYLTDAIVIPLSVLDDDPSSSFDD